MAGLVQNSNFVHQRKLSAKMKNLFSKVRHFINMQNVIGNGKTPLRQNINRLIKTNKFPTLCKN